jgi:hypothetical protein
MKTVNIAGWIISIDKLGAIKSIDELKKKHDFFTNLSEKDKEEAFKYLWGIIKPKEENKVGE